MTDLRSPSNSRFLSQLDMISEEVITRTRPQFIPASDKYIESILGNWLDGALDGGRFVKSVYSETGLEMVPFSEVEEYMIPYYAEDLPFHLAEYNQLSQFLNEEVLTNSVVFCLGRRVAYRDISEFVYEAVRSDVTDTAQAIFSEQRDDVLENALGDEKGNFLKELDRESYGEEVFTDSINDHLCDYLIEYDVMVHLASLPFRETIARIRPEILKRIEKDEAAAKHSP